MWRHSFTFQSLKSHSSSRNHIENGTITVSYDQPNYCSKFLNVPYVSCGMFNESARQELIAIAPLLSMKHNILISYESIPFVTRRWIAWWQARDISTCHDVPTHTESLWGRRMADADWSVTTHRTSVNMPSAWPVHHCGQHRWTSWKRSVTEGWRLMGGGVAIWQSRRLGNLVVKGAWLSNCYGCVSGCVSGCIGCNSASNSLSNEPKREKINMRCRANPTLFTQGSRS